MSERPPPAAPARQSMAKVVGEKIRGQILDGKLRPGERLVEDRLSAELGVSRVPVREALRELSAEGLVRIERNRGASVTEVTPAMVAELVEVRALLEGLNARLAAQRHDPEIVRQLGEVLKHGNKAADAGSTEQLARLNAEFVRIVARPDIQEKFIAVGADPATNTPPLFSALIRTESARWREVIRKANIRLE